MSIWRQYFSEYQVQVLDEFDGPRNPTDADQIWFVSQKFGCLDQAREYKDEEEKQNPDFTYRIVWIKHLYEEVQ
jgi:hypothetical protein